MPISDQNYRSYSFHLTLSQLQLFQMAVASIHNAKQVYSKSYSSQFRIHFQGYSWDCVVGKETSVSLAFLF